MKAYCYNKLILNFLAASLGVFQCHKPNPRFPVILHWWDSFTQVLGIWLYKTEQCPLSSASSRYFLCKSLQPRQYQVFSILDRYTLVQKHSWCSLAFSAAECLQGVLHLKKSHGLSWLFTRADSFILHMPVFSSCPDIQVLNCEGSIQNCGDQDSLEFDKGRVVSAFSQDFLAPSNKA